MDLRAYPLWTALVTPLCADGRLDQEGLSQLISEQKSANAGLLLLGSTAESLNLSEGLKKQILEHCIAFAPELPIMVGVPGHDLASTCAWLEYLETLPIHAYLMISPIYARPGDEGQYYWFKTLLDRVSRPVMIYNVPKRTGSALSLKAVSRLQSHPNYWAIKDASGSVDQFSQYLSASGDKPVFCGDDDIFPEFAGAGSAGLVSVASNVWPVGTAIYVAQCLSGRFTDHALWHDACKHLFQVTNPVAVKRLLYEEGRIASRTMMPPLSELDFTDCSMLRAVSERIGMWAHKCI